MSISSSSYPSAPQRTINPSDIDRIVEVNDLDSLGPLRSALGSNVKSAPGFLIWNPDTARVTVYCERLGSGPTQSADVPATVQTRLSTPPSESSPRVGGNQSASADLSAVRQCCEALDEAEKANKPFIGLQWFRRHVGDCRLQRSPRRLMPVPDLRAHAHRPLELRNADPVQLPRVQRAR